MGRDSTNSLAPGFRFHPTDEELVRYYLRRKVSGKPFRFDPISEVDIYKIEPWDLPGMAKLKTRDLEWYFFSGLDKKYGNGSRTNRATERGYWKTTGKDRPVKHNSRIVGMKKTLVFHKGRAPKGERSNWVMHEYRLADEELEKDGVSQDAFVLCRIFQKSGSGPKNGEQYGAPFVEEEWEDDEVAFVPGQEVPPDEFVYDDAHGPDVYVEFNDIDQNLDSSIPSENAPQPLNFYYGESSNYIVNSGDYVEDDQKPVIGNGETEFGSVLRGDQKFVDLPEQHGKPVKGEHFVESNNVDSVDVNYLLDEPYLDASDNNLTSPDGLFLETNDLLNPVESDAADFGMLDEYLAFFDAADDGMTFDPSQFLKGENSVMEQAAVPQTDVNVASELVPTGIEHIAEACSHNDASSSMENPEGPKSESDVKYPFLKRASQMLGSIPAPPAFASEFPSKDAALRFNQAGQASSSVHVTAGMIRIRNVSLTGNGMDWSFGKNGDLNITISFDLQGEVSPTSVMPTSGTYSGKTGSMVSRGWFYLMFIWLLVLLSVSFKIGSYIYTR